MLQEIRNVRQEPNGCRRWFESEGMDVAIWFDPAGGALGFQLCYDLGRGEKALTWRRDTGFAHSAIDAGDSTPLKNETPVLHPDPQVPWAEILRLFTQRSVTLEPALREFISNAFSGKT